MTDKGAYGNFPRFPLNIVKIHETLGVPKLDTVAVIDTKREGDTDEVQLSKFSLFEDRETGILEITLCKVGQFYTGKKEKYVCESWKYEIDFE